MFNRGRCCIATGLLCLGLLTLMGCGISDSSIQISPSAVLLLPGQTFQFNIARLGNSASNEAPQPVMLVNGLAGGSSSTGTITPGGLYSAPSTASAQPITIGIRGQSSSATVTFFSFSPGSVVSTQNPLVASYSITAPAAAAVSVQFGLDTSYGFSTSSVTAPAGGTVTVLVAGMRASTTYHMQATVELSNGSQLLDTDHTFTTGGIPTERLPNLTVQFGDGTPSPGVDLFSLLPYNTGNVLTTVATDLEGNVIWYYDLESADEPFPIKPLPNGHMLVLVSPTGYLPGGVNEVREIDLAGNIINRITIGDVDQALVGVTSYQIASLHHDIAALPNGHLILLGHYELTLNNMPGIPPGTVVLGDALVDWDPEKGPVWTWSTFDHLDLLHAPFGLADWTHSNAIIYSPDDGNLILSMRNQNWVIKINYQNGAGDGSILWRFGPGGDFTLPDGEAPIDWNYGQHYPTIVSPNSSGVFSLMFFDNGNNRLMDSNNDVCGTPGIGACYSSVPIFQVDESTKTASVLWQDDLFPAYSTCCGDALTLPNGNYEFDIAYDVNTPNFSHIEEVTPSADLVWKMDIEGILAYRGFRIPSLYPGQVWPATTPSSANRALPRHTGSTIKASPSPRTIEQLP